MSAVFHRAACTAEVPPGRMRRVDLAGRRILLANVNGAFYAADDTCTHEDASLARGSLQGEWVKCPLHNSRFNVRTGEVVEEPATERLAIYPVRIEGDEVWIGVTP